MTYAQALQKAMQEIMAADGRIVILGQDVRTWGGAGEIFLGLSEKYPDRVIDTPIAELATADIAVGMAMNGFLPIIEHTFIDFSLHAADAIINQAAKIKAMSHGQFQSPVIFRGVISSQRGYGPTHSQSIEEIFHSVPGLRIVYPSTPSDAYFLLKDAFTQSDPTLFIEHKLLHPIEGDIQDTPRGIQNAQVVNQGNRVTLVTYGRMRLLAEEAIKQVEGVELIDLRTISPLDYETIIQSVQKTGRLVTLEEGFGSIGAEIASEIAEKTFDSLKTPIQRIHSKKEVIPFRKELEEGHYPSIEKLVGALR